MSGRVVLGRYRVIAPLARGGMGMIYLGRLEGAAGFAKPVVIKTVIPDIKDDGRTQMFAREARIVSNLEHPNIVGVLDFGEDEGEYVMVLEYVHGFHLGSWLRYVQETRGSMSVIEAVEVMLPALDALDFAHKLQRSDGTPLDIVHRDVSPANILLDHLGHVKLHDFGIARMADDEYKTQDGSFRGTLSYTAPETLQGVPASPKSDLFACAVILYQLLSGSNPFKGQQPSETLHKVLTHVPPLLDSVRADIPPGIAAVVARALEKEPAKRFDSALGFAAALRAARTWGEKQGLADLQLTIQDDFSSPQMPALLGVETLQSRDAAWRAAQPGGQRSALSSSPPAPARSSADQLTATADVPDPGATIQALPRAELLVLARAGAADAGEAIATVPAAPAKSQKRGALIAVGGAVAALALAGASYPMWRAKAAEPSPRFLLIEKQVDPEPSAAAPPSSSPDAAPSAAPASPLAVAGSKAPRASDGSTVSAASGSTLTSAFQKQRGRVEGCFRQHSGEGEQPQLTVRFQVEASGAVKSAELQPASVAGSALGACILSIARSTRFPTSSAPVAFSIPITARKASR
jgi:serine/threonine protein kinase